MASPTKESSEVMKKYGINAFDAQGKMKPLSSVVDNLNSSLSKLTSQQRADVISTIFGTEAMSGVLALMNQGGQSVGDLSKKLKESNGAAKDMAETKLDNLNGQWIKLKAAVEHAQITLGEKLAPYAKEFVTWLTGKMPAITDGIVNLVDYISKNTSTIKSLAGTVLGLGVAFSTLSAIGSIGNAVTGVKSLMGAFKGAKVAGEAAVVAGGLKEIGILGSVLPAIFSPIGLSIAGSLAVAGVAATSNANLMKKSIATTTEELGPVEKIMNKLNGSIFKSKSQMVDLGLIYDDFGKGISDSFKTAAQDASKSLLKIEMDIKRLTQNGALDSTKNNQFKNLVNDFTYEGINIIKEKQAEVQSEFQKTFSLDGVVSPAEKGVLDYLGNYFEEGVNKELAIRDEVYKIGDKAVKDHGKILDEDMKKIKEKLAELKSIQLEYANAESVGEAAYARSKFKSQAERVTGIKGASELLQERAKQHQSHKDEIRGNYDKTIAKTQYLMDHESNPNKKAKLQAGLKESTAARDKALKEAEEGFKSDLATLYEQYPKAKGKLNEDTGGIFTGKDLQYQDRFSKMKEKFPDLKNITKEGFYGIKDSTTGQLNSLYVSVDKATGKVIGAWNQTNDDVGGYTQSMGEKIKELGNSHMEVAGNASQALARMGASVDVNTNTLKNSFGGVISELTNLNVAADGTRTSIANINGTAIQITSNADGQIINFSELGKTIDNTPKSANITISENGNQAKNNIAGAGNEADRVNGKTSTITIKTIYKNIVEWVNDKLGIGNHASGTAFSKEGFSTVNERGWELSDNKSVPILGSYNSDPLTYMSRGTKILNHMQSVQNMKDEVAKQVDKKVNTQQQQVQYQLVQPQQQVQFAGLGNINFGDINVNSEENKDIDSIIEEVTTEVGRQLRAAFKNVKR